MESRRQRDERRKMEGVAWTGVWRRKVYIMGIWVCELNCFNWALKF